MAATSEHLRATSSPTMPLLSGAQGLSPAAPSPAISDTTAPLATRSSTSSAQRLMLASFGVAPDSPGVTGKVGAPARRLYASSQQSLNAGPTRSRVLSGRPMAGLGRIDPHVSVHMIKKQQVRYWQQLFGFVSNPFMKQFACIFCWQTATEGADPECIAARGSPMSMTFVGRNALCGCTVVSHCCY